MPKRVALVRPQSDAERKTDRARVGTLKQGRISDPALIRYNAMLSYLFWLLPFVAGAWQKTWEKRDEQVSAFLEAMWHEGETRARAGDLLSALQWHYNVKGVLAGSWRIFRTWCKLEPSAQVPPLPISGLFYICGLAVEQGIPQLAALAYVAFHCFLRTGEMLALQCSNIGGCREAPVLVLHETKTSKRHGFTEHIPVEDPVAIILLSWLQQRAGNVGPLWPHSPTVFRQRWRSLVILAGLPPDQFTPYCLRRGGATFDFTVHSCMDRSLMRGRWASSQTAKIYIREGEEQLSRIFLSGPQLENAEVYRQSFLRWIHGIHQRASLF